MTSAERANQRVNGPDGCQRLVDRCGHRVGVAAVEHQSVKAELVGKGAQMR